MRDGVPTFRQSKTEQEVAIPIHPQLLAALAGLPRENSSFLTTAFGKPFSSVGFTNWFKDCVEEASLTRKVGGYGLSPHGLRKVVCVRLAEAGCSPHEIMAISGHADLAEVQRYTDAVDRRKLAKNAMETLSSHTWRATNSSNLAGRVRRCGV